ncbi:MAG: DNA polymerase I [Patescibacteria group bacterium]|nr:DNA polymerase I [Patescibacteria group bacterium]
MSDTKKKKMLVIDGNALIHRSFHALPKTLGLKDGKMMNAVYGFTSVLLKAIREFSPSYVVLTLDKKDPTWRHKEYKEYKATRVSAPNELYEQIPLVKEVAAAFNIPIFELSGMEADDLIGAIVKQTDGTIEKIIITGDLDTLQLISNNTKVYTMSRGLSDSVLYDAKMVEDRFGLIPEQIIDYKSLRGDPSDNIPGARGIGEKTAVNLLQNFKTLDNIYKNINSEKIKKRIRELLIKHKDNVYLSKRLATIITDVKIDFDLDKTDFKNFDATEAAKIFSKFEFKSLLPRLYEIAKNSSNSTFDGPEDKFERNLKLFNYNLIDDKDEFEKFLTKLKQQKKFAFDIEADSSNTLLANILGIGFCWKDGEAYYVRIKNQKLRIKDNLFNYQKNGCQKSEIDFYLTKLKAIFENREIKKIGHNIKYDISVLENYEIRVNGVEFDTRVASYLLNPGTRQHNLDTLSFARCGHQKINKTELLGKGKNKIGFADIPIEKIYNYCCEDADFTFRLAKKLKLDLEKFRLNKLFYNIEMPLIFVLVKMERNGIKIDQEFLRKKSIEFQQRIGVITKKVYQLAGAEFNINSPKQLKEILFEKLNLPIARIKKNKTGFSTSAEDLEKLKDVHPVIKLIQENRMLEKLKNTYIDALPKLINSETNRLHTSFNQTITSTGRLSSSNPNLQNIPVRGKDGKEIRRTFIAKQGYKLIALDYSQIELRLAASMSNDEKMIKAFMNGADIHISTAAEINQVDIKSVTSEMRNEAKAINFGVLYGQGPRGLSQAAGISYERAREFIEIYFNVYSGVKNFIDRIIEIAREKGYAETLFKRRRYLPDINSTMIQIKKAAERMAVNAPIQGTAADMIKIAMIEVQNFIDKNCEKDEIKMLLQVHDELIFEVKEKSLGNLTNKIRKIMESVVKLKVPIIVDAKAGDNWGEMDENLKSKNEKLKTTIKN